MSGSPATRIQRVSTDSRQAQAGDLFVALTGEHFDGHAFLVEVAKKGAVGVVIECGRKVEPLPGCAVIQVANARQALGQLAAAYRRQFSLPVIAVGGSNGKTTTKELIAAVLRQKLPTLWSEASFNNDIGVPATLLRLESSHRVAVLEAGTNHPGELAPLVKMMAPQFGVLTNIGREHLEFFGDLTGVAQEEGALADSLPADGTLFVNGDDEWSDRIVQRTNAKVIRVGLKPGNDWRAQGLQLEKSGVKFEVTAPNAVFSGSYQINLLGRHQVQNALFALAVGAELGLHPAELARGLAECQAAKMRLQVWDWSGVRVLDDAYNANTDSMLAALQVLQELPCKGRRVAVLGDMAELGLHSASAHAEVGRRVAELGIGQLIAVGKMAGVMGQAARNAGLNRVIELVDVEAAVMTLKSFLKAGDTVLLKASRSARLERITQALRAAESGKRN
ncbi:MAG: UDP-N-acetylmuramoyl-tripeptide--D-alanyl-D-alanine ligase [Verrucomicrobiota bacterium]|nr:UDP-N-acetylmuramoyl-tripeptide--D-alanyl-D-alanine ligase [Limisphaerales bacterium]